MRFVNAISGDVVELPPPNELGEAVVILNGVVIERALFSDADGGSVTLGDGRRFTAGRVFADYLVAMIAPKRQQAKPSSGEGSKR